ncbi:TonB-dependent receptor, plug [Novosphingobium nitrogenifigens DSM 19370]|uniref:TonB-dependent receptor, plug n=1 Tax=Novosphingobium nitrogenifigens DSM 19370 TaxID=983920 RepID=F1Z4G2_9SPHN|nr:TonB-dependent receptor [Novosphingobium nitrogenifigens]EGD60572.1 TonB-dependent receptor, plug [Novosphingobium nitrogenifigens DSM 19370]
MAMAADAESPAPPAGEAAAGDTGGGDIVVSARKRKENLVDTPLAISAYSGDTLTARGVPDIHQLDTIVPSLTVTNFGAGNVSDATLFIRGIGTADHLILTDPGVGVYVDGVYLGRSMGANLDLTNIDHVEVLRGPQGTLSGRNTLGGAVNVVTREPNDSEHYEFFGSLGTRLRATAGFYGNVPITDTLSMSLTGSFDHRNGIGKFVNLPGESTGVGQIDKFGGRLALKWQPSSKVSFLLAVDGSDGHYGLSPMKNVVINPNGFSGLQASDLPVNENDNGTENYQLAKTSSRDLGVSLTSTIKFDDHLSLKIIGSERYSAYSGGLDDDDSAIAFSEYPETGYARQYTAEGALNGEYGRFDFVTGIYFFSERGDANQPNYVYLGSPGDFYVYQNTRSWAYYAHGGFQITRDLKLSGGLRYTDDHKNAYAYIACCLAPGATRTNNWNAVTWDVALDYKIRRDLAAYATIQRGYESGGYPARPYGGAATFIAYNPTYATNYEIGLKGRLGHVLRFSSALFYTQYKDLALQYSQTTADGYLTITANAGRSRTWGVEFEGNLDLTKVFSISTSMSYNNAKITQVDQGVIGIVAGDIPQHTPRWTVAVGPQARVPLASGSILTARVDTSFRSSMYGQSSNNGWNYIKPRYLTNFDLSLEIPKRGLTVSVYGKNIFNEVYDTARIDQYDAGFIEVIRSNDRSEFGVRVRKTF